MFTPNPIVSLGDRQSCRVILGIIQELNPDPVLTSPRQPGQTSRPPRRFQPENLGQLGSARYFYPGTAERYVPYRAFDRGCAVEPDFSALQDTYTFLAGLHQGAPIPRPHDCAIGSLRSN